MLHCWSSRGTGEVEEEVRVGGAVLRKTKLKLRRKSTGFINKPENEAALADARIIPDVAPSSSSSSDGKSSLKYFELSLWARSLRNTDTPYLCA